MDIHFLVDGTKLHDMLKIQYDSFHIIIIGINNPPRVCQTSEASYT